jgi:DNA (cytosine-5)-methyltransferase 1
MDLGVEAAGFRLVGAIELDELARSSLQANRNGSWPLVGEDIADAAARLRPKDLGLERGGLGLLAGGPPCQPFSKAAQWSRSGRAGMSDSRAACLTPFLSLIDRFLPEAVLIENVPGFTHGPTAALDFVTENLRRINSANGTSYRMAARIIDAADYGVPQRRKRAIVVIRRDGSAVEWPTETHTDTPVRAWDAIGDLHLDGDELPAPRGRWAGLLPSIPEGQNYQWHTDRGGGRPLFGYRRRFWSFLLKLAKDQPAWTLPAQPGPSTGPFHWDNRPLAIREMLRLQTFPARWIVEGDYRQRVRQVGNATPPLLAEVLARSLLEQMHGTTPHSRPRHRIPRRRRVPRAAQVEGVPVEYLEMEGEHPAHPGAGLGPQPRNSTTNVS